MLLFLQWSLLGVIIRVDIQMGSGISEALGSAPESILSCHTYHLTPTVTNSGGISHLCVFRGFCVLTVFYEQKDSVQVIFINTCFLFILGSGCSVKRLDWWQMFRWWGKRRNGGAELAETTEEFCAALIKHWSMLMTDMSRNKRFFLRDLNIRRFTFCIHL
jgi:hypothetical protein